MGVEQTSGTDTRTETADTPPPSERPYTPPPDNPGSPSQASRLESRARARETPQQNGESQPAEERPDNEGKTAEAPGKPKPENRADNGLATGQDGREEKREGRTPKSGTDTRTDTAENPASSEPQSVPPPDNPGSPSQPSRLESLARAREPAQRAPAQDTAAKSPAEHDDKPTPPRDGNSGEAIGKPDSLNQRNDEGGPQKDDASGATTGGRDQRAPGTLGPEAARSEDQQHEPLRQQDANKPGASDELRTSERGSRDTAGPANDGDEPQPEQTTVTMDQPSTGQREANSDTTSGDPRSSDLTTQPLRDTEQSPQFSDGTGDDRSRLDTDRPQPTDNNSAEEADHGTQESGSAQGSDRDRTIEEPETTEPADESDTADRDSTHSGEAEESGRELAPHEPNPAEVESGRFSGRVVIQVGSDGMPIPERRADAETDTPHRGDARRPEDDPADRDPLEAERPSRRRDLLKEAMQTSGDIVKATNKAVDAASDALDFKPPPVGHPSTVRDVGAYMEPAAQPPVKAGSATIGLLGAAIMIAHTVRWSADKISKMRGSEHAGN